MSITIEKDESLVDANTTCIVPGVVEKPPLSSLRTHLKSPKCSPYSKKHTAFVSSSNSASQQAKSKCMWVPKAASGVSKNFTNSTTIDVSLGDLEKPLSEPFLESNLSLSKSTNRQTKGQCIWVRKGASPHCLASEDHQKSIKIKTLPELFEKPFSPSSSSSSETPPSLSSPKSPPIFKTTLSYSTTQQNKTKYILVKKRALPLYIVPKYIKELIKRDIVPIVLRKSLSPLTYKDYFATLLYAEDYYFEGIIHRVEKSKHLFVEFGREFYDQHYSGCKYDVKFSLNRVCLKRAHKAIEAASDVMFKNFLFPDCIPSSKNVSLEELQPFHLTLKQEQVRAVHRILMYQGPSPYLVEGPLSGMRAKKQTRDGVKIEENLTSTRNVVQEAVLQLWKASSLNRILICTNSNSACDALMSNLQMEIPESDIFRSNAAFRELDEVPDDILPHCPYEEKEELFSCPPLAKLEKFRLILSTFLSTSRLHNEGLKAGHFSHIFLVDASSAIEPETLVPLANLANEETVIVVSGKPRNFSRWVRSKIARYNGLQTSYFERLRNSELYMTLNPQVISQLSMNNSTYP